MSNTNEVTLKRLSIRLSSTGFELKSEDILCIEKPTMFVFKGFTTGFRSNVRKNELGVVASSTINAISGVTAYFSSAIWCESHCEPECKDLLIQNFLKWYTGICANFKTVETAYENFKQHLQ